MRIEQAILDTGPIVAALLPHDSHHAWARREISALRLPVVTCESVLSEAFFRLRKDPGATAALAEMIDNGAFRIVPIVSLGAVARFVVRYRVDFADACLVALSEQMPRATILTTDRRDFSVLRRFGREWVPFVAP